MIRQVALLKCSYFRLLSVRRGGILTSETVKIAIDLLCALWTIIIPVLAAFVNSVSLFLCRISNKKPMAFAIGFVFSMQKHRKTRNVPFPRPCGATGNDAQKTSCTGICAFSWCGAHARSFMLYLANSVSGQHQGQLDLVLVRVSRLAEAEAAVQAHRRGILRRAGHHDLP